MNLYLDIETLPAPEASMEKIRFLYDRKMEKWAKKKELDDETAAAETASADNFDKYFKNTCFDGSFGRVLCIAYALDDDETQVICNPDDEKKTIRKFWEVARDASLFVGHNVMDFDLRFIYQRSIILGVRPSRELSFARYRNTPIYDTMREWTRWGSGTNIGLEQLAIALDIPTPKEGIDGSQVYDFYKAGKVEDICDYCRRDVDTTRAVFKRMTFQTMPQAAPIENTPTPQAMPF